MAIESNVGPVNGRSVLQKALTDRAPQAFIFSSPLRGNPQTGSPVPVYHLTLEQTQGQKPVAGARMTRWLYPVIGGFHPGLADIRDSNDGLTRFAGLSHGILAKRFLEASLFAEQALEDEPESFQPRLLEVPALRFAALWLRGPMTEHFVSLLEGRPPGTTPLKLVNDIVSDLRTRGAVRLNSSNSAGMRARNPRNTPTN